MISHVGSRGSTSGLDAESFLIRVMFSTAVRALRRNLLSIIVLALVCLAISGFIPQHTPEIKQARKRHSGNRPELDQFMGAKLSKANMSGAQQLVDNAIKQDKVRSLSVHNAEPSEHHSLVFVTVAHG